MNEKINQLSFGYAGAIISGLCMLVLGILGNLGIYLGAVKMMQQVHVFFNLSLSGIITGIIEAVIIGFVGFYVFAWIYNKFA